ncbi:MAG: acyl-CoA dehydrogenase family protein [Sorangiineae bacterium]|nr:acyl-CoA dehydrogenase family protein [Polyangiaceae bacterium]MEB2322820.1 acyl-CoA dehydrogenase family protein [Sorangiineae bacterium]
MTHLDLPPELGASRLPALPADFGFTSAHAMAVSGARRLLAERAPIAHARSVVEGRAAPDPELYRELAGLGWLAACAPDAHGGAGPDHLLFALLLEEQGRVLLPSPLLASALALEAIAAGGSPEDAARLIPSIVAGECVAAVAVSEPGGLLGAGLTRAVRQGSELALYGAKTHVLAGDEARVLVVPARNHASELELYAVELPCPGVRVERERSVDGTRPLARFFLDGARVPARARLAGDATRALRTVLARGAAFVAAELVGAAEAVLTMTRDYAVVRQQFGRAIGSFQAVKHPLVDLMCQLELARSLSLAAACAIDHAPADAERAARMAKAAAGDALAFAVKKGVQLHGGFGFTWDCDAQLFFKRSLWGQAAFGDAGYHRQRLARELCG